MTVSDSKNGAGYSAAYARAVWRWIPLLSLTRRGSLVNRAVFRPTLALAIGGLSDSTNLTHFPRPCDYCIRPNLIRTGNAKPHQASRTPVEEEGIPIAPTRPSQPTALLTKRGNRPHSCSDIHDGRRIA